jgi:hypothetical protein
VLAFGASLNHWTVRHGTLFSPNARIVQVDLDEEAIGALHRVDVGVVGDAAQAAWAIVGELVSALFLLHPPGHGPGACTHRQCTCEQDRFRPILLCNQVPRFLFGRPLDGAGERSSNGQLFAGALGRPWSGFARACKDAGPLETTVRLARCASLMSEALIRHTASSRSLKNSSVVPMRTTVTLVLLATATARSNFSSSAICRGR